MMWEIQKPEIPKGMAVVDCHSHTFFSGDSNTTIASYVKSFEASGLTHAFVTDHQSIAAYHLLKDNLGDRILCGQEQRVREGEVIGLFISERIPPGLTLAEASRRIRDQGGIVYLCHPCDPKRVSVQHDDLLDSLETGLLDALELCNSKSVTLQDSLANLAEAYGVAVLGGSDAHVSSALGSSGAVMPWFDSAETFRSSITAATPFGKYCDPAKSLPLELVPPIDL